MERKSLCMNDLVPSAQIQCYNMYFESKSSESVLISGSMLYFRFVFYIKIEMKA